MTLAQFNVKPESVYTLQRDWASAEKMSAGRVKEHVFLAPKKAGVLVTTI